MNSHAAAAAAAPSAPTHNWCDMWSSVGLPGKRRGMRVLCVCATLCVVEEKHIVNGVEHVKQQTGRPRRTTRTVCCHFLCAAGFKVRTRVQGVWVGVCVCVPLFTLTRTSKLSSLKSCASSLRLCHMPKSFPRTELNTRITAHLERPMGGSWAGRGRVSSKTISISLEQSWQLNDSAQVLCCA